LRCPVDGLTFSRVDGVWRFLLPEREAHYTQFIREYETVRGAEGRGDDSPEYYRALPFKDLSGRFSQDWGIRARSYRALIREVVAPLERYLERPLTVLDLGSGNGWLSARLAERHAQAMAVDLLTNPQDGLGAWRNYPEAFTPVQAEFTRLPLADRQMDLVVFNASFHYAEHYEDALAEALRVLAPPPGLIIVMDSPVYRDPASGAAMVSEREADFTVRYGFSSNSLHSENFLTYARVDELGRALGIHWQHLVPNYGLRWRLRPWLARRRGLREPAEFGIWIFRPLMEGESVDS
jgi:SAM-dependent methyltransferase